MYNFRFILLIVLVLHTTVLFSQNTIKGMVCDTDGVAIPNANVVLWRNDTLVAQSVNSEHGFLLENIPDDSYILNISHVGYQIKQITLDVNSNIDLDSITLSFIHELDEVVITAARNITSYRNNLLHINVNQTFLSELPNMESVLGNIPGVLLTNNKLTYFGKGQILLLINGREVKSLEEVNTLQPSQISEIVVDNMPGAKYDSRYSSVLNIKTVSEKPALMVYNTNTWGRHYSGTAGFTSQSKVKNVLIDYGYGFRKRTNTLYSEQMEENLQTDNTFERVFNDTTVSYRKSHDWHIGIQSKLGAGTLSLKYSGYYSSNKPEYSSFMQYTSAVGIENFNIQRTGKYKEQQHLATLDYLIELKSKNTLRITTDYLYQHNKDNSCASESSANSEKLTLLDFNGKYNIYSLLAEYEHCFNNSIKLSTGMRYSNVYSKNDSREDKTSTFYSLHENRYALYTEGSFQWRKMTLLLGLRCERFDKRYHCTTQDVTKYKDLFFLPSFALSYLCSEKLQFSLSGNKKVSLPSFNELTPIITYLNQYSYMTGNPFLKPAVRYDFCLGMVWLNKFNVKLEYDMIKDDRVAFSAPDESSSQVLKYTYTNIDKARQFTGTLTYSDYLFKRHAFSLSAGVLKPRVKVPYLDQYLHLTKLSYFMQLYSNWKLSQMVNFSVSYVFQSKSYDKVDTYSATHDLGCNISIVPIKNKLSINLQINDILKKANGNWETKYGYIRTRQINNADSRNITLSLRYIFNSFKSIRQGSSNSEEIERL